MTLHACIFHASANNLSIPADAPRRALHPA